VYSALLVVRLDDDEPVEEPVCLAVDEASLPDPVSSCACTPSAASHNIHTGRDNMIVAVLNRLPVSKERASGEERVQRGTARGRPLTSVCGRFVGRK
jgi:hypothetical protein